ncbi:DUF3261 domain-containing protein [Rhodoferax sp. TS-BS-61-7]|uniref:DUF3261 domain-containing protein n=1 Tax=Rhodoferax sp. TS-BS-61-7 TaxID=2094194 RepID=UPI000CF663D8|nr:DUF3261 domain-containing protein [Rhodoferax sp. TS-BS-61-7]PQA78889.1 DUF3261 domain-containing protein [Rhodoferax sp. TS-BS-61-7]
MRSLIVIWLLLCLGACAAPLGASRTVPELRLSPQTLGTPLSLAQHLSVSRIAPGAGGMGLPQTELEALLEMDAQSLRLAVITMGQRVLTVQWDGERLQATRNEHVPAAIDAVHVLRDIQLLYWPAEAIRAQLPAAWSIDDTAGLRTLRYSGQAQVEIVYSDARRWVGQATLSNYLEGYRMRIDSVSTQAPSP